MTQNSLNFAEIPGSTPRFSSSNSVLAVVENEPNVMETRAILSSELNTDDRADLNRLRAITKARDERVHTIDNVSSELSTGNSDYNDISQFGPIFDKLNRLSQILQVTRFTKWQLIGLYRDIQPFFQVFRTRGANPSISKMDSLILLLAWYSTGQTYQQIARSFQIGDGACRNAINRSKPIVFTCLKEKYWDSRIRPEPLDNTEYPYIGLLVDCHTVESKTPAGTFEFTKQYWDAKNHIYGYKCNELQTIENNYAKNLFYQRKKKDEDKRERRRISNQNYCSRRQTSTAVDIYLPEHIDYTL